MAYHLSKERKNPIIRTTHTKSAAILFHIAQTKGFFYDRGVKINTQFIPAANLSMDFITSNQIDLAYLMEINIAYLGYLDPQIPIKCIASVEKRYADSIVMRHSQGETPTPQDLRGKTIGFAPRTTSHGFLVNFLRAHNIPKQDIKLKALNPQTIPNALIRGDVDAISIWYAHSRSAIVSMHELGLHWTQFHNDGIYESEVVLAVTKPFLVKHRKTCRSFILALQDAERYIKENPHILSEIISGNLRISMDRLKQANPKENLEKLFKFEVAPLNDSYLQILKNQGQWIRENDTEFLGRPLPDYSDFIDNSFFSCK